MEDREYIEGIIHKHLNRETSAEEEAVLTMWLQESPDHVDELNAFKQIWGQSAALESYHSFNAEKGWSSLEQRIADKESVQLNKNRFPFRINKSLLLAAATLVILVVSAAAFYILKAKSGARIVLLAATENLAVNLPDDSHVILRKGSSISYNRDFAEKERKLSLNGEAYFDIHRNESIPFVINSINSTVRVLGTSFLLRTSNNGDQLYVDRGQVRFEQAQNSNNSVIVNAGEKASLIGKVFDKDSITNKNFLSWQNGLLKFENVSLRQMIDDLEHHFEVKIEMTEALASKSDSIKVNFNFSGNTIEQVLDEIKLTTGLKAETKEGTIILQQ